MYLPPGFDQAVAVEAGALVGQAYEQYDQFLKRGSWSLEGNYDLLGVLKAKPKGLFARVEPFGFVARNKATRNVFVTFRGTESLEDWLSDFTFPQRPHPWGRIEEGFERIYGQCAADVRTAVKDAGAAPAVIATGHSLGAALAVLAAADLVDSGVAPGAGLYNFAGPRVGDRSFAEKFNARVGQKWRVVNTEDIVPTLPLASVGLLRPRSLLGLRLFFWRLFRGPDFEHVGTALSFTVHKGSIPANHALEVYRDAVSGS